MTSRAEINSSYEQFCVELEALLLRHKTAFMPDYDAFGEPCEHAGEDCDCQTPDNAQVAEWVVICNYIDLDTEKMPVIGIAPQHQRSTHTMGLIKFYEIAQGWR